MSFETEPVIDTAGKIPPHSIEAEQGVLGCLMMDPQKCMDQCIERAIAEESFYELRHQTIFKAISDLFQSQRTPDLITITQKLKEGQYLDEIGGMAYLSSLMDVVPSSANLPYYLEIILEKQTRRRILQVCSESTTAAYTSQDPIENILDVFERDSMSVRRDDNSKEKTNLEVISGLIPILQDESRGIYPSTIATGIADFDHYFRGYELGNMVVVGARPSVGKTAFALQKVLNMSQHNPVGIFSLEMTHEALVRRMLGNLSGFNLRKMDIVSQGDQMRIVTATVKLKDAHIRVDDQSGLTIRQIESRTRKWVSKFGIKVIILDYLQLAKGSSKRSRDDRRLEVSEISAGLKGLAKDLKIVVIVLSQISRKVEDRGKDSRPRMADLLESGSIEQDADWVEFLWAGKNRDGDDDFTEDGKQKIILSVEKNRDGPTGDVHLLFDKPTGRFLNISKIGPND